MTIQEAKANIGNPFKALAYTGVNVSFDIIRTVDDDGMIEGDFVIAHCNDCRLKMEQPEQLQKHNMNKLFLIILLTALLTSCQSTNKINSDYKCMGSCGDHHKTGPRR